MCKQTKEEIYQKTKKADFCIWVAIVTALFVTMYAEYCKYLVRQLALNHDIKTVTPSDYTLHMFLNEKQSLAFENFYKAQKLLTSLPRGEVFMLWLKREFALFSDDQMCQVLRVDPIFDNRELIGLLRQRGYAIATNDIAKARALEDKIDVEKQYEAKICGAFLTFETDVIMEKAINIWKQIDPKVRVERAQEPTVYIWENMSITNLRRNFNKLVVFSVLAFLMYIAYHYQALLIKNRLSLGRFEQIDCHFIR